MGKARPPLRIADSIQSNNHQNTSQIYIKLTKLNTDIRGVVYPTSKNDYLFILNEQLDGGKIKEVYYRLIDRIKKSKTNGFFVI